eukprot:CAMPEP_0178984524 /NCGR_PEP_ID=MMETSP0795-20121207/1654_1 /TAXON_ID=88552 /ORGANISM="Amoebophrya sp., Strain Ameob2" /LENGTH=693 /DNA_ID=CAMNT_0020675399 /DNA_START=96 /DNA_END=2177 /DNA_ORIENTATION=-
MPRLIFIRAFWFTCAAGSTVANAAAAFEFRADAAVGSADGRPEVHHLTPRHVASKLREWFPWTSSVLGTEAEAISRTEYAFPGVQRNNFGDLPDAHRNASELITTKGYPLEFHKVTTEDGYILTLFRIPHGRKAARAISSQAAVLKTEKYDDAGSREEQDGRAAGRSAGSALPEDDVPSPSDSDFDAAPAVVPAAAAPEEDDIAISSRIHRAAGVNKVAPAPPPAISMSSASAKSPAAHAGGEPELQGAGLLGPPVLLQHGLLDSCATWVVNEPDESLAFLLADRGYDVWLGNTRGSTYSLEHVNLTTADAAFWDFSFDEIALQDTPAVVDYILETVKKYARIGYVGHSQGTLQMFLALSSEQASTASNLHTRRSSSSGGGPRRPLHDKIAHYAALAPVAYASNQQSLLVAALLTLHVDQLFEIFGNRAFLPNKSLLRWIAGPLCGSSPEVCEDLIFLIVGNDADPTANLNKTRVPVFVYNSPSGTSVKNMVHWADLVRSGELRRFDYGFLGNLFHYGSVYPPGYDLRNIANGGSETGGGGRKRERERESGDHRPLPISLYAGGHHRAPRRTEEPLPISLYAGGRDALADPKDVGRLESILDSVEQASEEPSGRRIKVTRKNLQPTYQHLDFTWGMSCKNTIYPMVLEDLREANFEFVDDDESDPLPEFDSEDEDVEDNEQANRSPVEIAISQ